MHTDQRSSNRKNSEKHKKELTNKQNQQNKQTNKTVEDDIPTGFFKTGNKQLHRSVTNIKIIIAHDRILVSSCHSHRQVSSLELIFNLLYQLACNIFRLSFTFEERECVHPVHTFVQPAIWKKPLLCMLRTSSQAYHTCVITLNQQKVPTKC